MDQYERDAYWGNTSKPEVEPAQSEPRAVEPFATEPRAVEPLATEPESTESLATEPVRPLETTGSTNPTVPLADKSSYVRIEMSEAATKALDSLEAPTTHSPVVPAVGGPTQATEPTNSSVNTVLPTEPTSARGAARQRRADRSTSAGVPVGTAAGTKKKSGGGLKTFLLGFLGAALAFGLGWAITGGFNRTSPAPTTIVGAEEATTVEAVNQAENLAEAVAEKALPSVVAIDTYVSQSTMSGFWGYGAGESGSGNSLMAYGLGSGVVISSDGYVLNNYHVIEGADKVMVTIGGQEYEGTVAGTDPSSDLAVIKVESEEPLPAIEIGDSSSLKPGQWVMTLGSPFGLEQSVATGIISAVSRTVVMGSSNYNYGGQSAAADVYANMIQTDAAINPGNSGGALVDQNGHLIGINSVIESYSGSYSGVGFAIPVNYAMNIAQQIIDGKTPTHAQIGVATTTIDASIAERYGLSVDKGAYISKVYDNSGAAEAGFQPGDIITKVDNTSIASSTDLVAAARAHTPGEQVEITFVRDGETQTATVTLGSDENTELSTSAPLENELGGNGYGNGQGGNGYNMDDLLEYFGYGQGGNGQGGGHGGYSMDDLLEYFGYGQGGGQNPDQQQDAA